MAGAPSEIGKAFYQPKSPQFFKVILQTLDQGIKLPPLFVKKYGDRLDKVVTLKDAVGVAWPVELVQINGGTWLHKGLKELGEFYSIEIKQFMVFRFIGNSQFLFSIFDETCLEIDYPIKVAGETPPEVVADDKKRRFEPQEKEAADAAAAADDSSSRRRKGKKRENINGDDHQQIEIIDQHETESPGMSTPLAKAVRRLRQLKEKGSKVQGSQQGATSKSSHPPESSVRCPKNETITLEAAHERAKLFRSENPFFIRPMRTTHCSLSYTLNIPRDFLRRHMIGGDRSENYELRLPPAEGSTGNSWPVHVVAKKSCGKISGGWRKFAAENSVATGNACVFELVKETKTFLVHIYR